MKCYYHPDREATTRCSVCGKPICDEDIAGYKNGKPVCKICAIGEALTQKESEDKEKLTKLEKLRRERAEKRLKASQKRLKIMVTAGVILLIAEVIAYIGLKKSVSESSVPPPQTTEVAPDIKQKAQLLMVFQGIQIYRFDKGKLPENLDILADEGYVEGPVADMIRAGRIKYTTDGQDFAIIPVDNDSLIISTAPEKFMPRANETPGGER